MKILITTDILNSIRDNEETKEKWNIDRIMTWGTDLNDSLRGLPYQEENISFFIPTVIDSINALAYDGANLALRILFKYLCHRNTGINIVLLGFETTAAFLKHYSFPNILKIPGVTYRLFNRVIVSNLALPESGIKRSQYKPYLENLGLSIPSSFKSTHSLTNEWSLYKWNSYMNFIVPEDKYDLLYYDYIKAIEKINNVKSKSISNNPNLTEAISFLKNKESKVLLIDDNIEWHSFFTEFFKDSHIQYKSIGNDFKKQDFEEVQRLVSETIDQFSPDVVLLDFRLIMDKDADADFKDISGTRILKQLKGSFDAPGESFGRQILIFTATSRIENILRLKQLNADGFILKEKPAQYASKEITKDSISRMVHDITRAMERAEFLIPLNEYMDSFIEMWSHDDVNNDAQLKEYVIACVNSVRLHTQNNELSENILKLVFLNLFSILEQIKHDTSPLYPYITTLASNLHLEPHIFSLWEMLCDIRRALAHGDNKLRKDKLKGKFICQSLLIEWIDKLCLFIQQFFSLYLRNH